MVTTKIEIFYSIAGLAAFEVLWQAYLKRHFYTKLGRNNQANGLKSIANLPTIATIALKTGLFTAGALLSLRLGLLQIG